jgi:hypothetical protein
MVKTLPRETDTELNPTPTFVRQLTLGSSGNVEGNVSWVTPSKFGPRQFGQSSLCPTSARKRRPQIQIRKFTVLTEIQ